MALARRRFFVVVGGVTVASHLPLAYVAATQVVWLTPLVGVSLLLALLVVTTLLRDRPGPRWVAWLRVAGSVHWAGSLFSLPFALVALAWQLIAALPASQLLVALLSCYGLGSLLAGWGVWTRRRVRTRCVDVSLPGLDPAFESYRLVQLSDLHIGSFDGLARGLEWVQRCNALAPDAIVVTGDLVTTGVAFYEDAARVLGALKARDGVWVILGNHDQADATDFQRRIEAYGPQVLRNRWVTLERAGARLILAGLDDPSGGHADLERTLADRPQGSPTVLLAHYPSWFDRAAPHGVELTLSGHTHGGQIGVPGITRYVNVAAFRGRYVHGLYRQGDSQLYVSAGLGTTGPPLRLGIYPEISVLELRPGL